MAMIEHTCVGPDCDRHGGDFGYCSAHYQQWKQGKDLTPLRAYTKGWVSRVCSVSGCGRPHKARGLCKVHCDHLKKYGEVREIKPYGQNLVCGIAGCGKPHYAKLRCAQHLNYGYNLARFGITSGGLRADVRR